MPREARLEQRFACLETVAAQIRSALGEPHNFDGFQEQHLMIPELEEVVTKRQVCFW